jgi:hypothetical protein
MPEGKRPLGRHKCRWQDNVKIYHKGIRWSGMDWIHLAQARAQLEGYCEHGSETLGTKKHEILQQLSDWWLLKKDSAPWN